MTTRQILIKTRKALQIAGWKQNTYGNWLGGFCLAGALNEVTDCKDDMASRAIHAMGFECEGSLSLWNDRPGRTHEQVLARIDAALESLPV
jgi:hypothetical protein